MDFDLIAISFAAVLALGAIWLIASFFEDGGGLGTPIYEPAHAASPA